MNHTIGPSSSIRFTYCDWQQPSKVSSVLKWQRKCNNTILKHGVGRKTRERERVIPYGAYLAQEHSCCSSDRSNGGLWFLSPSVSQLLPGQVSSFDLLFPQSPLIGFWRRTEIDSLAVLASMVVPLEISRDCPRFVCISQKSPGRNALSQRCHREQSSGSCWLDGMSGCRDGALISRGQADVADP